ncbi:hypothetical protein JCM16303_001255 [Sporobolomyces ruberrimus]
MPHTNNANAADRKASRSKNRPAFLTKKSKKATAETPSTTTPSDEPDTGNRADKIALIREFHALEKKLKSPQTTEEEKETIRKRQEEMGGIETYQKASLHGADKARGGETSKWLIKQLKQFKVALDTSDKGKGKEAEKVEPTILEDGTKVWPKPKERRKLRLLDVGAIAGTAYASETWIHTTSIDLNPQAPHVIKSNFFDFPIPAADEEDELFDVVSLSLVMNFEGSLINRGHFLLRAHEYLKRDVPGYLYLVLPLPCVTNSRYLTHQHLRKIFESTNWEVIAHHDSNKLTHWFLKEVEKEGGARKGDGKVWKREEVRRGVERNNFCIVVKPDEDVERDVEGEKEKEIIGEQPGEAQGEVEPEVEAPKKGGKANNKRKAGADAENKGKSGNAQQGGNKKRKAQDDEAVESTTAAGLEGADGDGDQGEGQTKKKAKKSKPIKGKKIVFGDDA